MAESSTRIGFSNIMDFDQPQQDRPETCFFPETPNWANISQAPGSRVSKRHAKDPGSTLVAVKTSKRQRANTSLRPEAPSTGIQMWDSDPWDAFEKGIEIFPGRHVYLARDHGNKARLVHIQHLAEGVAGCLLENINRHSHRSFLRLLHCYQYGSSSFLVWEPVELSLSQVLGSKCSIREAEMVSIIWPILTGIRYLRDCQYALASLASDTILFTEGGDVRIAGVEHSCEICAADMNKVTMKLLALSDIVKELRKKMNPLHPWSTQAQELPEKLMDVPLDDLLRDDIFRQMKGGDLKMLVSIASKTGYYNIRFPQS
ncbi:hypothetical protein N7478_000746 [Penicillium angulare]|uniref:uncharacterized protein n=1 Tax=Penicillium angulare TaxID=116970 RepID=UPI002541C0AA|nr:uncharacterized protein N7478_000666 [Penicillium angulare]XP_056784841.1 uncharacterized protein N7478_000746 [Penicillium angulare]KAJ5291415.1 hypothetical protein N7478_000666 [Penicillium angulare]KAJ5291495.1 hypothetical protein N7478_000746 [Penicillium angulare]